MMENTGNRKKKGKSSEISGFLKAIIGGRVLRNPKVENQYPFIFFVGFLAILLISNRYRSERIIRQMDDSQDTIKDLRSESISIAADLMNLSRPSEVALRVQQNGLKLIDSDKPPGVIVIDNDKK
ncbi:MAG: FtsL-like putative cell division protein [Bacteroidota bacterium]|nr:FtsL-like putative cell division protein [Bacteroidota bacterium]